MAKSILKVELTKEEVWAVVQDLAKKKVTEQFAADVSKANAKPTWLSFDKDGSRDAYIYGVCMGVEIEFATEDKP